MKSHVIFDSDMYRVTSYGHGLAYLVTRKDDNREFAVQGDDAQNFYYDVFGQNVFTFDTAITFLYEDSFQ